jgi:hypothetical protein
MAKEDTIKTIGWINILAGIWLILSPVMFSSIGANVSALWNNIIVGVAILLLAGFGVTSARTTWSRSINAILGAWMFLSPFFFGFSNQPGALWNNLILGAIVFVASISGASMSASYGGKMQTR